MNTVMELARGLFSKLDTHWHGDEQGMHRPGYSTEETQAHRIIAEEAKEMVGCEVLQDLAGNCHMVYPGMDRGKPAFLMGSHTDAVPNGGKYDGPLGVIGALSAIFELHANGERPPQDTVICNWRAEESPWFGQFAVGSHLATGRGGPAFLDKPHRDDARSLREHMRDIGLDIAALEEALASEEPLLPFPNVAAFAEAHVEQDSELYDAGIPLGIVHSIRGNIRFPGDFLFTGDGGHSGARPMHKRNDAARAGMKLLDACFAETDRLIGSGHDIVMTAPLGVDVIDPQRTRVPDAARVAIEIRSREPELLETMENFTKEAADAAEQATGASWSNRDEFTVNKTPPAELSPEMIAKLTQSAQSAGVQTMPMPSGAGHDASVLQQAGIPAAMIFQRHGNGGLSHAPGEMMTCRDDADSFASDSDFARTVRCLAATARADHSPHHDGDSTDRSAFVQALEQRGAKPV